MPEAKLQFYYDKSALLTSIYNSKPLTFTVVNGGGKIWILDDNGDTIDAILTSFYVSFDGGTTWSNEFHDSCLATLSQTNTSVMVQGVNETIEGMHFVFQPNNSTRNAKIKVSGNLLSLIVGPNEDYSKLPDSEDMPELPNGCFKEIFMSTNEDYPTNLIDASKLVLSAKDLPFECYASMFEGCTDLVTGPALPSTNLGEHCYDSMFKNCTSLNYVPELPTLSIPEGAYMRMFNGCTSMTKAPELPAMYLSKDCYFEMFSGCTSITYSPELPATTMYASCYYGMFGGSGIFAMPDLKATELAESCYAEMFQGCTNLVVVTDLNAPVLEDYCYRSMFQGCTSIEHAPKLPATVLTTGCYEEMFKNCSNLNYIRALFLESPLVNNAYPYTSNWVYGVAEYGDFYQNEDAEWELLNENAIPLRWRIHTAESDTFIVTVSSNNNEWGTVSGGGTYLYGQTCTITATALGDSMFVQWHIGNTLYASSTFSFKVTGSVHCTAEFFGDDGSQDAYKEIPFTIKSTADDNDIYIEFIRTVPWSSNTEEDIKVQYKINNGEWQTKTCNLTCTKNGVYDWYHMTYDNYDRQGTYVNYIILSSINTNDTIQIKSICFDNSYNYNKCKYLRHIGATKDYNVYGNLLSLVNGDDYSWESDNLLNIQTRMNNLKFFPWKLFRSEIPWESHENPVVGGSITSSLNLMFPPIGINYGHISEYYPDVLGFFNRNNRMTDGPKILPAQNLVNSCYKSMFSSCNRLTTAPTLPATTLATECYREMFAGCDSLTTAPELPATTLANYCYTRMFSGCASLTTAPSLPALNLTQRCYNGMFESCIRLTTAPILPASKLVYHCYSGMFQGCIALNSITVNAIVADSVNEDELTKNWVKGVALSGDIYYKSRYSWSIGDSGLPTNWTKHAS